VTRHSPCVGICQLDDATGYCLGCGRTGNEVADWLAMSDAQRDSVWAKLPERLRKLAVHVRLLRWTPGEIGAWAIETIAARRGTWTIGASASAPEFSCERDREVTVRQDGSDVVARTSSAALRLRFSDRLRAFAVTDGPIVLGLPNRRAAIPIAPSFKKLGPDRDAVDQSHRNDALFDCGIGHKNVRLCVRIEDPTLAEMLSAREGLQWCKVRTELGPELQSSTPVYIAESAMARIETFSAGAESALPDSASYPLSENMFEQSAGQKLPPFASPVAIFSPSAV
jgi:predicted Fe-S protein YdhL (DUF1289 family)